MSLKLKATYVQWLTKVFIRITTETFYIYVIWTLFYFINIWIKYDSHNSINQPENICRRHMYLVENLQTCKLVKKSSYNSIPELILKGEIFSFTYLNWIFSRTFLCYKTEWKTKVASYFFKFYKFKCLYRVK